MKTAKELDLTEHQYQALIQLREGLCRGEFVHRRNKKEPISGKMFNMSVWKNDCGTLCCIGGWVETLTGEDFNPQKSPEIHELTHPGAVSKTVSVSNHSWRNITEKQAAAAITNFLEEGHAHWDEVLK